MKRHDMPQLPIRHRARPVPLTERGWFQIAVIITAVVAAALGGLGFLAWAVGS